MIETKVLAEFVKFNDEEIGRYIHKNGFNNVETEDIKQDFYLMLLEHNRLEKFNSARSGFTTYIMRCLSNLIKRSSNERKIKSIEFNYSNFNDSDVKVRSFLGLFLYGLLYKQSGKTYYNIAEVKDWWNNHTDFFVLIKDWFPKVYRNYKGNVILVTPFLIITLLLLGHDIKGIQEELGLSALCIKRFKTILSKKTGLFSVDGLCNSSEIDDNNKVLDVLYMY